MASKVCPQCNAEYELNQKFCSIDGAVLRGPGGGDQLEGSIVGGHEVLRRLGEGGMGFVYLARSVRTGRLDALKVMRAELTKSAEAVGRFSREAMNAARIQHQNVAIVYDVGDTDDGLPYLAMEYINGESLHTVLQRTRTIPWVRAAEIVRQVADALEAAHQLGIVHRDMKPENVMIVGDPASGPIKLVDFGISKVAGAIEQQVTSSGVTIGSPAYMSPEQAMGGAEITTQSDVYSLALVAYQMLAGRLPFDGEGGEVMMARVVSSPLPLRKTRPDVPWSDELERVLAKGLMFELPERYQRAAEFAADFARAVRDLAAREPTLQGAPTKPIVAPSRAGRRAGSRALPAWSRAAMIGGGVVAVGAVGVWVATRDRGARPDGAPAASSQTDSAARPAPTDARTAKADPATQRVAGATTPVAPTRITFPAPTLRVRVLGLSPAARGSVDSAVLVAALGSPVRTVDASGAADVALLPSASGRLGVEGIVPAGTTIAPAADSVLAFLRYAAATRDLAGLTRGALANDLAFAFEPPVAQMYLGDSFRFRLQSRTGGYLTILDVAPSGHLTVLGPNAAVTDVQQLLRDAATLIPELGRPAIGTGPPAGAGQLWAIVTRRPLNLPTIVSKDAARAAAQVRRELERTVGGGDAPWSVAVLPYELKPRR